MRSLLIRIYISPKYSDLFSHWFLRLNAFTLTFQVYYLAHSKPVMKVCHIISSMKKIRTCLGKCEGLAPVLSTALYACFRRKSHSLILYMRNVFESSLCFLLQFHLLPSLFVVHDWFCLLAFTHTVLNTWNIPFIASTSTFCPWQMCACPWVSGVTFSGSRLSPKLPILLHGVHCSFYMLLGQLTVTPQ